MKASDIMTPHVVTISPNQSIHELAELMTTKGISGVPVTNAAGELIGIVTEGDLLRRMEMDTEKHRSTWRELFTSKITLAREYVRSRGKLVEDVMTNEVVTAEPDTPLSEIVSLMERNRVRRVPIVQDRKVIGIISRSNFLQLLISARTLPDREKESRDDVIRASVLEQLREQPWVRLPGRNILVSDGTVHLWGTVLSTDEQRALQIAVSSVPGVKAVEDHTELPTPYMMP